MINDAEKKLEMMGIFGKELAGVRVKRKNLKTAEHTAFVNRIGGLLVGKTCFGKPEYNRYEIK